MNLEQKWYMVTDFFRRSDDERLGSINWIFFEHKHLSQPLFLTVSLTIEPVVTAQNIEKEFRGFVRELGYAIMFNYADSSDEFSDAQHEKAVREANLQLEQGPVYISHSRPQFLSDPDDFAAAIDFDVEKLFLTGDSGSRLPSTEYLRQIIRRCTEYCNKLEGCSLYRAKYAFSSLMFSIGDELCREMPGNERLNYFIMPVNSPINLLELKDTAARKGGTLWSANRHCRRGDIALFYFTRSGARELQALVPFEQSFAELLHKLPGSICASARFLNDAAHENRKDIFGWNYRAFIGDIRMFEQPVAIDQVINERGENLGSIILQGGLMQPKSLYKGDEFLPVLRKMLFSRMPELENTYLQLDPAWPDDIPVMEDPAWAEKIGLSDVRCFENESSVRRHFIDALLWLSKPDDVEIQEEFFTDPVRHLRVDYLLFNDSTKLMVEAKYDINIEEFNVSRVHDYLRVGTHPRGLLIDVNGVYEVCLNETKPKILFLRAGMGEKEVSKLKKWLKKYFSG